MGANFKDSGLETTVRTETWTNDLGPVESNAFIASAKRRSMEGVTLPNYHVRVKRGELLPHTRFSQYEWSFQQQGGGSYRHDVTNSIPKYNTWWSATNYMGPSMTASWRVKDFADVGYDPGYAKQGPPIGGYDYLVQQAAGRIATSGYDALTALAEFKKTKSMFKSVTTKMLKLATNMTPRRMMQAWLEGRYGWRTLAYDVRDLHEAVTEFDGKRKIWSERAGTSISSSTSTVIAAASSDIFNYQVMQEKRLEWSLRGSITARIQPPRIDLDPSVTAWELTPYSFVVDFVYDVGTSLDALKFRALASEWTGSTGYQCRATVTNSCTVTSIKSPLAYPKVSASANINCNYVYEGTYQSRSPISAIPVLPQLTNRGLTADLALDLRALSQLRQSLHK